MSDLPPEWPKRWHTREESGLRLDADGRWWHDDVLIEHPRIIDAFNRGLTPTEDGRYRLDFGRDYCFVQVEDAAYRVLSLEPGSPGGLLLHLTDASAEPLDAATLRLDARGVFVCRVKRGRALARFSRQAQAALGEWLVEDQGRVWLVVGEARTRLALEGGSGA